MFDDPKDLSYTAVALAIYAGSWIVANTAVPEQHYGLVTGLLLAGGILVVGVVCRTLGISPEVEQCKAATNDGDRCSRDANGWFADLCTQHQNLNDIELHPSAVDGTVVADDVAVSDQQGAT